jgi:ribonuclease/clavin/mitogillin
VRVCVCAPANPPPTSQGTNTYVVGSGAERILVDTGEGKDGYTALVEEALSLPAMQARAVQPSIRHIICTHWHHDHVGGVRDVMRMCACSAPPSSLAASALPERLTLWKFPCPDRDDPALPFKHLQDGDTIAVEGMFLHKFLRA